MDMLHRLNEAISYTEANLDGEIEMEKLARITCIASASFLRFFSYMIGMSPKDYIRRRRLSRAAYELRKANARVIDLALWQCRCLYKGLYKAARDYPAASTRPCHAVMCLTAGFLPYFLKRSC